MKDPMGSIIAELVAANIAHGKVRGAKPAPGDVHAGAPTDPFIRFVVVVELGSQRLNRTPVQIPRYGIRAYAPTPQDARALYGEISDVLHIAGGRVSATSVPLYQSRDDGSSASEDPKTGQPYYEAMFEVIAGTLTFV